MAQGATEVNTHFPTADPAVHPKAIATIYKNFANDFPKIKDGVRGMAFIKAAVESSAKNAAWTKLDV